MPFITTNFPDREYLRELLAAQKKRVEQGADAIESLVMWSGAALNWLGDAFTDPSISWTKKEVPLSTLYLTGTNPEWNKIVKGRAQHSAVELAKIFADEPDTVRLFADARWDEAPILVREHEGRLKVLDGMHRVIAAVRDGRTSLVAWIAARNADARPRPSCEPHVVYDFIRAYQIGSCSDRAALVAALRFLDRAYGNVRALLAERFGPEWVPDDDVQDIIREVLAANADPAAS